MPAGITEITITVNVYRSAQHNNYFLNILWLKKIIFAFRLSLDLYQSPVLAFGADMTYSTDMEVYYCLASDNGFN